MHPITTASDPTPDSLDIRAALDAVLRHALAVAVVVLALVPAARGHHEALGWLPLWLLGMPAVALWALRGCPVPVARNAAPARVAVPTRARRTGPQARRRARRVPSARPLRAA